MELCYYNVFSQYGLPNGGNLCAVVVLERQLSTPEMQEIATTLDAPETVFIRLKENKFFVRFFATKGELPLCVHGAIGAASHLMKSQNLVQLSLYTGESVELKAEKINSDHVAISMALAQHPFVAKSISVQELSHQLTFDTMALDLNFIPTIATLGSPKLLLGIKNKKLLFNLKFDHDQLAGWSKQQSVNGIYLYTFETFFKNSTCLTRSLNPLFSTQEDCATGIAAATLCKFFYDNEQLTGDSDYIVEQGFHLDKPSIIKIRTNIKNITIMGLVVQTVPSPLTKV